jgi:hypothetical protein
MDRMEGLIMLQRSRHSLFMEKLKQTGYGLDMYFPKYEAGINDCLTRGRVQVVSFYPNTRRSNY